jgi:spore coat protein H
MLQDVNDMNQDINDVIKKHFDRDNYITWMAMNILLENHDTNVANFYLLSPVSQDKWYFVPWDYDFTMGYGYQIGFDNSIWSSEYMRDGVSMYWGVMLHRRFLMDPQNLKDLTAKIEELSQIATKDVIAGKISKLYNSTNALVKKMPDLAVMGTTVADYEAEIQRLSSTVEDAKKRYYAGLKKPMPFNLHDVQIEGKKCTFTWDKAYDMDNDAITYDFFISDTPFFDNILVERRGIQDLSVTINSMPSGTYFWKAEAVDSSGNRREAFDVYYEEEEEFEYFGIRCFSID